MLVKPLSSISGWSPVYYIRKYGVPLLEDTIIIASYFQGVFIYFTNFAK